MTRKLTDEVGYTVTARLIIAKTPEGSDLYAYQGVDVPPGQTAEWLQRHLDMGFIAAKEPQ